MTREEAVPAALADEREAVQNRIHGLRRELDSMLDGTTSNDDEHDPEGSTVAYERAQVSSLLDRALRLLFPAVAVYTPQDLHSNNRRKHHDKAAQGLLKRMQHVFFNS